MTIVNRNRYYCSAKRERGTCDSTVGITAQALEDRILTGLKNILIGNEPLLKTFAEAFKAEVTRLRKERGRRVRQVQQELNKVDLSIRRCLTFITDGDGDPGIVRDELRTLEAVNGTWNDRSRSVLKIAPSRCTQISASSMPKRSGNYAFC